MSSAVSGKTDPSLVRRVPVVPHPTTRLWLVRHAEVEAAYQNVFGGKIDMNLSPRGDSQAQALASYLHRFRFDAVYASPMRRVQQTLKPLLGNGLPSPTILHDLREVDFGIWTGLPWEEVEKRFGVSPFLWLDQLDCDAIPEAECAAVLRKRIEPCLTSIREQHAGQNVLVLCHGGVIRVILAISLGLTLSQLRGIEVEYASLTQISCKGPRACLELLNFTPWRDLPT